jgi:hypothetical protein
MVQKEHFLNFGPMPLFLFLNTQTMKQPIIHKSLAMFSLKPYALADFEPGSSVPEAVAMSTPPGLIFPPSFTTDLS